ncbi:MAG: hypothetical protein JWO13_2350 [Acidobacteriales bacterium]|nr:hypothetical protein [Terriglobales bacterium]
MKKWQRYGLIFVNLIAAAFCLIYLGDIFILVSGLGVNIPVPTDFVRFAFWLLSFVLLLLICSYLLQPLEKPIVRRRPFWQRMAISFAATLVLAVVIYIPWLATEL